MLDELNERAVDGFISTYNAFANVSLGTPHPVNDGYLGVHGTPTGDGGMQQGYEDHVLGFVYPVVALFGILIVCYAAGRALIGGVFARYQASEAIWMCAIGAVAATIAWEWVTFHQMFSDGLTMYALPSGEDMLLDRGSRAKFLAGNTFAILVMATVGIAESVGLLILYGGRQVVLNGLAPYLMVLVIVMQFWGPHRYIRALATYVHFQWLALVYWPVPVAVAFDMAFGAEWSVSQEGVMAFVETLGLYSGALLFPIFMSTSALAVPFLISRYGAQGVSTARQSRVAAGTAAAGATAGSLGRSAAGSARTRLFGGDDDDGPDGYPDPPPSPDVSETITEDTAFDATPTETVDDLPDGDTSADTSAAAVRAEVDEVSPANPVESDWKEREQAIRDQSDPRFRPGMGHE